MDERRALAQLRDVLANLYSDVATIRRVVHDAGLNEERIDFSHPARDSWHAVLQEAQKHERVKALLEIATNEYANNPVLQAAWKSYQAAKSENLLAPTPKHQIVNKQKRYTVALQFIMVIVATALILFVFAIIFQSSITKMLMSGNQPIIPTETKTATVKIAKVIVTTTMSAITEAQTLLSFTETPAFMGTPTPLPPISTPTATFTPLPTAPPTATATPTSLPTPTPSYPCSAVIKSDSKVNNVRARPAGNSSLRPPVEPGQTIQIKEPSGGMELWYHIYSLRDINGKEIELGWIAPEDICLSSACPGYMSSVCRN